MIGPFGDQSYGMSRIPPPAPPKPKREYRHWSFYISETLVSTFPDSESLDVILQGGADNGQFCYIQDINHESVWHRNGCLQVEDIVMEIQGQKIAGYTLRDATKWLKDVSQNATPVMIKTVQPGLLPVDLHIYLNTRFEKGSADHDLQQIIRNNLYLRTIPCTTRPARPGELNGVDYTFLSPEEFTELEQNGSLLESGLFEDNYYGTPKPPSDPGGPLGRRSNSTNDLSPENSPPRPDTSPHNNSDGLQFLHSVKPTTPTSPSKVNGSEPPLPENWEMSFSQDGTRYFINHDSETTEWLDPRLVAVRKSLIDCSDNELPYGWEIVADPHYGTYYIDHVNKCTQYENPVLKAKRESNEMGQQSKRRASFTKDPTELKGTLLTTHLVKSVRGFGFTIVGGNVQDEEFLQIKNIVPNGPCYTDGKLKSGDILVNVDSDCVLGYTHQDVISLFQSITPNTEVRLEVCRGYPLLYDIDDPNTEVRTAVAVTMPPPGELFHQNQRLNVSQRSIKSLPDLARVGTNNPHMTRSITESQFNDQNRHDSSNSSINNINHLNVSRQSSNSTLNVNSVNSQSQSHVTGNLNYNKTELGRSFGSETNLKGELIDVYITRGDQGFGFTIADCSAGQKVKKIVNRSCYANLQESDILCEVDGHSVINMKHPQVKKIVNRSRCANLQESDILCEVDGHSVINMKHSQVASLLMSCPTGVPTKIIIQRGVAVSHRNKKSSKQSDDGSLRGDASFAIDERRRVDTSPRNAGRFARPKTPTSTMDTRIRTPAPMDTRPKTPTSLAGMTISDPYAIRPFRTGTSTASSRIGDGDSINSFRSDMVDNRIPPHRHDVHPPPIRNNYDDYRRDFQSQSQNGDHNPGENSARPGQFRSRTPGPEMMSSRTNENSSYDYNRPELRSKTPLPYNSQNMHSHPDYPVSYHNDNPVNPRTLNAYQSLTDYPHRQGYNRPLPPRVITPTYPNHSNNTHNINNVNNSRLNSVSSSYSNEHTTNPAFTVRPNFAPNDRMNPGNFNANSNDRVNPGHFNANSTQIHNPHPLHNNSLPNHQPPYNNPRIPTYPPQPSDHYPTPNPTHHLDHTHSTYMPMDRNINAYNNQPLKPNTNHIQNTNHTLNTNPIHHNPSIPHHNTSSNNSVTSYSQHHNSSSDTLPPPPIIHHATRPLKQGTSFENVDPVPSSVSSLRPFTDDHSPHSGSYMSDQDEPHCVEMDIFLERTDTGFGFRIIGGTEEGSQVSVGYIVPGGAADHDAQLHTGDEITHVDSICVVNSSHAEVVQLIGNASQSNRVLLSIRRHINSADSGYKTNSDSDAFPYDVTLTRHESEGFGFTIISSLSKSGTTIGQIIRASPAERNDKLHVGDRVLAVNGLNITNLHHDHIVNLIKDSPLTLTLTIGAPIDDTSSNASTSQQGSQGSLANSYPSYPHGDPSWRAPDYTPHPQSRDPPQGDPSWHAPDYTPHTQSRDPPPPPYPARSAPSDQGLPPLPIDARVAKDPIRMSQIMHQAPAPGPGPDYIYTVHIQRGSRGFGFSIRGGQEFNHMPLFVLRIAEGGAAHVHSSLRVGDQILEINGCPTENMTHADAIALIQSGGSTVRLTVKRTGRPPPPIEGDYLVIAHNMTHADAIALIQSGGSTVRLTVKRTGRPPPPIGRLSSYRENMTQADALALIQSGGSTVRLTVKRTGRPPPPIESTVGPTQVQSAPRTTTMNGPIGHSSPQLARRPMVRDDLYNTYGNKPLLTSQISSPQALHY